ncbi:TPA: hypothetical protein ACRRJ9_001720 [Klebsiella pneumoniae]
MATNNFKAFALDPNANVISQADWEALPALLSGFTAGKASSAQVNKALRQATTIAEVVGRFIANAGDDALDDGDIAELVTKFTSAISTNLNLGSAAKRDVGTGNDQIPDMSSFSASDTASSGWYILPNGHIHQYGIVTLAEVSTYNKQTLGGVDYYTRFYTVTLPRAYPTAHIMTVVTLAGRSFDKQGPEFGYWANCNRTVDSAAGVSKTQFVVEVISKDANYVPVVHYTSEGY